MSQVPTTAKEGSPNNTFYWCWCAILSAVVLLAHLKLHIYAYDDAYIHIRISQHLLDFGLPYYNLNQSVMASSSPVWTLVLSLLGIGASRINLFSIAILNWVVCSLNLPVWTAWSRRVVGNGLPSVNFFVPLLVASTLLNSSVGSMETPLALLFLGAGCYLIVSQSPLASLFLALAIATRVELVLIAMILAWPAWKFLPLQRRQLLIWFAVGAVPIVLYELYFFGTLIPHTVSAKAIVYDVKPHEAIHILLRTFFGENTVTQHRMRVLMYILILTALATLMFFRCGRDRQNSFECQFTKESVLTVGLGLGGVLILVGYILKHALIFPWYLPLFTLPILIAAVIAAAQLKIKLLWLFIAVAWCPLGMSFCKTIYASFGHFEIFDDFAGGARARKYIEIGSQLQAHMPHAKVLSAEIGGLGIGFQGPIIDAVGLVSPEALEFHPLQIPNQRSSGVLGAVPPRLVEALSPDVIIGYDIFLEAFLKSSVREKYELKEQPAFISQDLAYAGEATKVFGSQSVKIFYRK